MASITNAGLRRCVVRAAKTVSVRQRVCASIICARRSVYCLIGLSDEGCVVFAERISSKSCDSVKGAVWCPALSLPNKNTNTTIPNTSMFLCESFKVFTVS